MVSIPVELVLTQSAVMVALDQCNVDIALSTKRRLCPQDIIIAFGKCRVQILNFALSSFFASVMTKLTLKDIT